jgi:hypothetical protein
MTNHHLNRNKMKTKFSFLMICMFAAVITLNAQVGGQPRTVEERVKTTMEKLAPLALDKDPDRKNQCSVY